MHLSMCCRHLILLIALLSLGACATTPAPSSPPVNAPVEQKPLAADTSDPTLPVDSTQATVTEVKVVKKTATRPSPKPGSVQSVISKMENSPYTLYWREKNSYSYYIGGQVDAEYKPGSGLTVRNDVQGDNKIVCEYDAAGNVKADAPGVKEACAKLLFSLDGEL